MRTLSSLLRRKVVTESGESLGRLYDLRGELTPRTLRVTGLVTGKPGLFEHLGMLGLAPDQMRDKAHEPAAKHRLAKCSRALNCPKERNEREPSGHEQARRQIGRGQQECTDNTAQ